MVSMLIKISILKYVLDIFNLFFYFFGNEERVVTRSLYIYIYLLINKKVKKQKATINIILYYFKNVKWK